MPRRPHAEENPERHELLKLIKKHDGDQTRMAAALGTSRQIIGRRLKDHGLTLEAGKARRAAGVHGGHHGDPDPKERQRIVTTWARLNSYRKAAKALKLSTASMARKIKAHGITQDEIEQIRAGKSPAPQDLPF